MTRTVQELITTFEALTPQEQHTAAVEILRRVSPSEPSLTDEALDRLADELFEALDEAEAGDGSSPAR